MTKTTQKKRTRYHVSAEQFISAWREVAEAGGTVTDFCAKVGMPRDIVYARASEYRQAGVRLPKLRRTNAHGAGLERLNRMLGVPDRGEFDPVGRLLEMVAAMSG